MLLFSLVCLGVSETVKLVGNGRSALVGMMVQMEKWFWVWLVVCWLNVRVGESSMYLDFLWKHPSFSSCMQNDATKVLCSPNSFCKKPNTYYWQVYEGSGVGR